MVYRREGQRLRRDADYAVIIGGDGAVEFHIKAEMQYCWVVRRDSSMRASNWDVQIGYLKTNSYPPNTLTEMIYYMYINLKEPVT